MTVSPRKKYETQRPRKKLLQAEKKRTFPTKVRRATALELLFRQGVIDDSMKQAGDAYVSIYHQRPVGGPLMSASQIKERLQTAGASQENLRDYLEPLWQDLLRILRQTPARDVIHALLYDNDYGALAPIYLSDNLQRELQRVLKSFSHCLERHKYGEKE